MGDRGVLYGQWKEQIPSEGLTLTHNEAFVARMAHNRATAFFDKLKKDAEEGLTRVIEDPDVYDLVRESCKALINIAEDGLRVLRTEAHPCFVWVEGDES